VPDPGPVWRLEGFLERLDIWAELEAPSDNLRILVTSWILTRFDDPYQGVRREPRFANFWFGVIPRSRDSRGTVVTCAYWIEESRRTVRCDSFVSLNLPL